MKRGTIDVTEIVLGDPAMNLWSAAAYPGDGAYIVTNAQEPWKNYVFFVCGNIVSSVPNSLNLIKPPADGPGDVPATPSIAGVSEFTLLSALAIACNPTGAAEIIEKVQGQ